MRRRTRQPTTSTLTTSTSSTPSPSTPTTTTAPPTPAPTTTTEFAVRGRGTSTGYTAKFEDSSTNPLLYIKDNGNVTVGTATDSGYKLDVEGNTNTNGDYYVNGNQGYSGNIVIDQSPNPAITITVEGGIITNVS